MRNYYAELIEKETVGKATVVNRQNRQKPFSPPFVSFVSEHTGVFAENKNDREVECRSVVEKHFGLIYGGNAVNAYMEKLERVRRNPFLADVFEDYCEERKSLMVVDGRMSEEAAEAAILDMDFLIAALLNL